MIRSFERYDKRSRLAGDTLRASRRGRCCVRIDVLERRGPAFELLVHPQVLLGREPDVVLEPGEERARVGDRVVARETLDWRPDVDAVAFLSRQTAKEERKHRRAADRREP